MPGLIEPHDGGATVIPEPRRGKHEIIHDAERLTFGERVADQIKERLGSWRFLIIQTALIAVWVAWNGFSGHAWDIYPFVLLNLFLSFQAGYTGPILQMTQNRQDAKDHLRDELEAREVEEIRAMQVDQLMLLSLLVAVCDHDGIAVPDVVRQTAAKAPGLHEENP